MTILYKVHNNLYVNLTNKCPCACTFCLRQTRDHMEDSGVLWLEKEPTVDEVIADFANFNMDDYDEVVFCGFGEPTFREKEIVEIGRELKKRGYIVRLDTNGQGNLINGRDITGELAEAVDKVNVSLNECDAEKYFDICRPVFGEDAYSEIISFAKKCRDRGLYVTFSVVDVIGAESIEKCKKIAAEAGIPLRVREFIKDS